MFQTIFESVAFVVVVKLLYVVVGARTLFVVFEVQVGTATGEFVQHLAEPFTFPLLADCSVVVIDAERVVVVRFVVCGYTCGGLDCCLSHRH